MNIVDMNDHLRPRIFLNDGKGNFNRDLSAFDSLFINAVSIVSTDFNGDGYPDLIYWRKISSFKIWTDTQVLSINE